MEIFKKQKTNKQTKNPVKYKLYTEVVLLSMGEFQVPSFPEPDPAQTVIVLYSKSIQKLPDP